VSLSLALAAFSLVQAQAVSPAPPVEPTRTVRETRSISFALAAPPETTFPLFGPRDEHLWLPSWSPRFLFPTDGSQSAEGAVFLVPGAGDAPEETWIMTTYDKDRRIIEYAIVAPGYLAGELHIAVEAAQGSRSSVSVRYRFTALSDAAGRFIAHWAQHFPQQGPHWSETINRYLASQGFHE
jgi:hypothetical protein